MKNTLSNNMEINLYVLSSLVKDRVSSKISVTDVDTEEQWGRGR